MCYVRATTEECLALAFDKMSRGRNRKDELAKRELDVRSPHSKLFYLQKKLKKPIMHRDYLSRLLWKKRRDGSYLMVTSPTTSDLEPRRADFIRGSYMAALKMTKVGDSETRIELVVRYTEDNMPAWILRKAIATNLNYVTGVQEAFEQVRGMDEYDEVDGRALGFRLMNPGGEYNKAPWKGVARMIETHKGLKEMAEM